MLIHNEAQIPYKSFYVIISVYLYLNSYPFLKQATFLLFNQLFDVQEIFKIRNEQSICTDKIESNIILVLLVNMGLVFNHKMYCSCFEL